MTEYICFQAEDGIRDYKVTGVQTCSLPIFAVLALVRLETALLTTADLAHGSLGGALAGKQGNRRDLLPDVRHEIRHPVLVLIFRDGIHDPGAVPNSCHRLASLLVHPEILEKVLEAFGSFRPAPYPDLSAEGVLAKRACPAADGNRVRRLIVGWLAAGDVLDGFRTR